MSTKSIGSNSYFQNIKFYVPKAAESGEKPGQETTATDKFTLSEATETMQTLTNKNRDLTKKILVGGALGAAGLATAACLGAPSVALALGTWVLSSAGIATQWECKTQPETEKFALGFDQLKNRPDGPDIRVSGLEPTIEKSRNLGENIAKKTLAIMAGQIGLVGGVLGGGLPVAAYSTAAGLGSVAYRADFQVSFGDKTWNLLRPFEETEPNSVMGAVKCGANKAIRLAAGGVGALLGYAAAPVILGATCGITFGAAVHKALEKL